MLFGDTGYGLIEYWKDSEKRLRREAGKQVAEVYHYHGKAVRKMFLAGSLLMVTALPFFYELIPYPVYTTILATVVLIVSAGLTNPHRLLSVILDVFVSLVAVITFEYYSVYIASAMPEEKFFFLVNQILAVIFLFALYFAIKTLRGMIYD